jgi:hypothetical protein
LSFIALYFIWVVHTILFRRYPLKDKLSIFINGLLLFTVLFYVQPLKFLAGSFVSLFTNKAGTAAVTSWQQLQNLFVIYDIGWIVVFALVAWLYHRAYTTRESLRLTPLESYDAITWSRHYIGFVLAGVVSILIALSGIGIEFGLPGIAFLTIGLFAYINGKMRDPGREQLAQRVANHPQLADTTAIDASMIREALR